MAAETRGRTEMRQWRGRESSPENANAWSHTRTTSKTSAEQRKVDVVYYISRNGQLEHPHFMEVPLSSPEGLYLRDVINRLNVLRGRGMASMYSWSSKRSYKSGFVWHDLSEENFIHPVHGNEYVLKGTELLHAAPVSGEAAPFMSMSSERPLRVPEPARDESSAAVSRRKKASWGSFDVNEYRAYRSNELLQEPSARATDASTQTDDKRNGRGEIVVEEEDPPATSPDQENPTTELSREEISPPPSSSSPETLETLINADGRRIVAVRRDDQYRMVGSSSSGRMKASAVLLSLFSCGSISVKEHGLSLVSQYRGRLPHSSAKETEDGLGNTQSFRSFTMENKEYFSGSLIETKKLGCHDMGDLPSLRRSSSFNADRVLKIDLDDEVGSTRTGRKSRLQKARKERNPPVSVSSTHGSKRN